MQFNFEQNCHVGFHRYDFLDQDYISIVPLGDFHIGHKCAREDYIQKVINYIAENPHTYTILNGDLIEGVTRSSIGNIYDLKYTSPDEQVARVIELLLPIQNRILSITSGNHDTRSDGHDFSLEIARYLKAPYHPIGSILEFRVGIIPHKTRVKSYVYTLFHTHGHGRGATKGAKANSASRHGISVFTDVVVISHHHDTIVTPQAIYIPDLYNKKVIMKRQICIVNTGWLEYGDYSLRRGMSPSTFLVTEIVFLGTGKGGIKVINHT